MHRLSDSRKRYIPDQTDLQIIGLLRKDGRMPLKRVASLVHKSVSPVYSRVRKLERAGVITGYRTIIDPQKTGRQLFAITLVSLSQHSNEVLLAFRLSAENFQEVIQCSHIAGNYDFVLYIAASDKIAYEDFEQNRLRRLAGVIDIQTNFVVKVYKSPDQTPIE